MIEKIYGVSRNGLLGVKTYEVEKETPKTYKLKQPSLYSVVRKDQMQTNHVIFFTEEKRAYDFYESIVHPKKTNADRIRAMSEEELAKFIIGVIMGEQSYFCHTGLCLDGETCVGCYLKWIQQPAEEDDHE